MLAWEYLGEILLAFVTGFLSIFVSLGGSYGGLFGGFFRMINVMEYLHIFNNYKKNFSTGDYVIAIIGSLLLLAFIVALVWVIVIFVIKVIKRFMKQGPLNDDLLDEITRLNGEVRKAQREKEKALQLSGLLPDDRRLELEDDSNGAASSNSTSGETADSRFYKLTQIDLLYASDEKPQFVYNDNMSLADICDNYRNWACKSMRLYYEPRVIRLFVSALSTTRLIILQGISGTGKTSLPYSMGQWLANPATIASVQPSWRDRTEIFGYFNEFTKRYNETEILRALYEARHNERVYLTVIDEANISRIEYYFAELLSIYELPSRENWLVDLTTAGWSNDPKLISKGRFMLPGNMWYIATINNDDSTFAISDKVYDRAIPININTKGIPFEPDETKCEQLKFSYNYMEKLFKEAQETNIISPENLKKFNDMDDYVIKHFRLAFGNRIVKQLREFIPVYVACGGTEIDGLDYILCNKILRKFESLNFNYIRDEIDGYVQYLNDTFGEENMTESKDYLERLKKLF